MAERSVEVINQAKDSYGTGCLLAPGLVLTACHVAKPGGGSTVKVKHGRGTAFTEATVVWKNTALDAVLLKADPGLAGSGMQAVRFGELVCDYPAGRPVCTMTGFPRAMRRRISPDRQVDDPKTVDGYVAPHTGSHSQVYGIEVARALPTQVMDWQGMSGSGLFCSEMLIGLVRSVPTKWQGVLLALPVSQLLAAEGFSEAVTAATGLPPSLAPADLAPLLERTPLPRLSSSYLLDPRARTVGLTGIQPLAGQLAQWCQEPEPVDFAAVTGLGGTGKTRLVTEVLDRLSHAPRGEEGPQPWSGGFLAETPEQTAYGMLASGIRPLLIAIDLADTRLSQIREVMATMAARSHGAKVRVLLLARGHDHWWPALSRHVRALHLGPAGRTFRITPADALTGDGPEDVYVQAKADFARRIRLLQKLGHAHGAWQHAVVADAPRRHGEAIESADRQPVIYHHIAALADLLAHASPDLAQRDHPLDVLVANEEEYLRRIAEARLPPGTYDPQLIHTLVAAQYLAGARTRQEGRAAVTAAFDVHHHGFPAAAPDVRQLAALDDVLTAAYPATDAARWSAIGTPLAAVWLDDTETRSGHVFIETFLRHHALSPGQRQQSLSTLARTAEEQPDLVAAAHRAVAADPELLLPLAAGAVAAELSAERADRWLAGLQEAVADRARHDDAMPETLRWAHDVIAQARHRVAAGDSVVDQLFGQVADDRGDPHEAPEPSAPPAGQPPRAASTARPAVPVRPASGTRTRLLTSAAGITHFGLLVYVTCLVAYRTADPGVWAMPLAVVSANAFIALFYGHWKLPHTLMTWGGPAIVMAMNTGSGMALSQPSGVAANVGAAIGWTAAFGAGLLISAWSVRAWGGQLQYDGDPFATRET